ncbi:unnamed protein product [Vitrella brassicaformis CCMP3155]|uniref:Uncharacterized protein n=2 Tax=Vitrella brassicaformis TaxID=1169539 RepID=A0A0G4F158_VITBC|nr:unnamed protein product [Vitrella brassicaformis CCMP3155]|mmetsp:Transcript_29532/g.73539  ORF Transcript_29532/g.73539 Transcript_29532/m.73539 type:complete len:676 (+) Transcript_29532:55-2082(+)|eukprot:CEM05264.1 unnamed protein product [Vitrella brassicaformis CCMP3155]
MSVERAFVLNNIEISLENLVFFSLVDGAVQLQSENLTSVLSSILAALVEQTNKATRLERRVEQLTSEGKTSEKKAEKVLKDLGDIKHRVDVHQKALNITFTHDGQASGGLLETRQEMEGVREEMEGLRRTFITTQTGVESANRRMNQQEERLEKTKTFVGTQDTNIKALEESVNHLYSETERLTLDSEELHRNREQDYLMVKKIEDKKVDKEKLEALSVSMKTVEGRLYETLDEVATFSEKARRFAAALTSFDEARASINDFANEIKGDVSDIKSWTARRCDDIDRAINEQRAHLEAQWAALSEHLNETEQATADQVRQFVAALQQFHEEALQRDRHLRALGEVLTEMTESISDEALGGLKCLSCQKPTDGTLRSDVAVNLQRERSKEFIFQQLQKVMVSLPPSTPSPTSQALKLLAVNVGRPSRTIGTDGAVYRTTTESKGIDVGTVTLTVATNQRTTPSSRGGGFFHHSTRLTPRSPRDAPSRGALSTPVSPQRGPQHLIPTAAGRSASKTPVSPRAKLESTDELYDSSASSIMDIATPRPQQASPQPPIPRNHTTHTSPLEMTPDTAAMRAPMTDRPRPSTEGSPIMSLPQPPRSRLLSGLLTSPKGDGASGASGGGGARATQRPGSGKGKDVQRPSTPQPADGPDAQLDEARHEQEQTIPSDRSQLFSPRE